MLVWLKNPVDFCLLANDLRIWVSNVDLDRYLAGMPAGVDHAGIHRHLPANCNLRRMNLQIPELEGRVALAMINRTFPSTVFRPHEPRPDRGLCPNFS